jgi:hypothetical protein
MEFTTVFDIHEKTTERTTIEIADYIELGRMVAQWARDPASRPGSVAELRRQLTGVAVIPASVKTVTFSQNDDETLHISLPDRTRLSATMDALRDDCSGRLCNMPYFYRDYFDPGFGPVMSSYETFLARLGDGVISEG